VASFNDWLEKALPASGRRATTQALYSSLARTHLTAAPFGALPLDRLRPSDIEALLLAKRDAGLAEWSVRAIYTVVRQALETAVRDGLIRRNPAAAVKRPTVKRSEARYLTPKRLGGSSRPLRVTGCIRCWSCYSAAVYAAVRRWRCTGGMST
jgi:site-specific recombinase XerC